MIIGILLAWILWLYGVIQAKDLNQLKALVMFCVLTVCGAWGGFIIQTLYGWMT